MSWDAYLWAGSEACRCEHEPCPHKVIGQWNYTHNTNGMIEVAIEVVTDQSIDTTTDEPWWSAIGGTGMGRGSWWDLLNGLSGAAGAEYLDIIVRGLESDPDQFRRMNPENGWGNFDDLLKLLTEMRNFVPEWPAVWSAHG